MEVQKHKICRQIIMLSLRERNTAWQIQQEVGEIFNRKVMPKMNEILSHFSSPESVLKIERLEIDLGGIRSVNLEEEFTARVEKWLYEELSNQVKQFQLDLNFTRDRFISADNVLAAATSNDTQKVSRVVSGNIYELESLQHFLETGTLPWWVEKHSTESLEKMFMRLLETAPVETKSLVEREMMNESARQRMIYQFSNTVLCEIVEKVVPVKSLKIQYIINELCEICENVHLISAGRAELHFLIWDNVLKVLSTIDKKVISEDKIIEFIIKSISSRNGIPYDKLIPVLQDEINKLLQSQFAFYSVIPEFILRLHISKQDLKNIESALDIEKRKIKSLDTKLVNLAEDNLQSGIELSNKNINNLKHFDEQKTSIDETGTIDEKGNVKQTDPGQIGSSIDDLQTGKELSKANNREVIDIDIKEKKIPGTPYGMVPLDTEQIEDDFGFREIYIENSGLVILWPYLGTFLKNIKLLNDGRFVNEASKMRAVLLLQYLVTNKCESPEHLLPLNKLLCGRNISAPVSNRFEISDYEKNECERLLSTIILHWSALRNTSVEGFRTSFLQRNGVLVKEEARWLLRVERTSYDMLIDNLPWGISMIKLSWMKTLLNVEW